MKTIGQFAIILVVSLLVALLVWPRKKKHSSGGCGAGCSCHLKDDSQCSKNTENQNKGS